MSNTPTPERHTIIKPKPVPAILNVGTYGVHIIKNPANTFSFVGTCPRALNGNYPTYDEALDAFIVWFNSQNNEFKAAHTPNLREDLKALIN